MSSGTEEPQREMKHSAARFPIEWEDVITQMQVLAIAVLFLRRLSKQK